MVFYLYEQGINTRDLEFAKLQEHKFDLEKQKKEALKLQQQLILEINSQSDPAWVELVLIKVLGLLPEGQTKVYFNKPTKDS